MKMEIHIPELLENGVDLVLVQSAADWAHKFKLVAVSAVIVSFIWKRHASVVMDCLLVRFAS